jgi:plastocyanin
MRKLILFAVGVLCVFPGLGRGAEVMGRVRILGSVAGTTTTVIYAESLDGPSLLKPGHYRMVQHNKSFEPHVLAVPAGSTVDFLNEDLIFHNVFSLSRPYPFDLGLYRAGVSKSRVFPVPATYRVFCNIHPQMTGILLVLPTSWIVQADSNGSYRLDLPAGRYRVTAWCERAKPVSLQIKVGMGTPTLPELTLDGSHYVQLPHKNKFGQDYPPAAYNPSPH